MQDWFEQSVQMLSPQRFHLHLTPKFSSILDADGNSIGDYKFFNKPYGLRHWMEHLELLRFNKDTLQFPEAVQSDVIFLIDPDMILLRPHYSGLFKSRDDAVRTGTTATQTGGCGRPGPSLCASLWLWDAVVTPRFGKYSRERHTSGRLDTTGRSSLLPRRATLFGRNDRHASL